MNFYSERPSFLGFVLWLVVTIIIALGFGTGISDLFVNNDSFIWGGLIYIGVGIIISYARRLLSLLYDNIPPYSEITDWHTLLRLYAVTFWPLTLIFILFLLIIIPIRLLYSLFWEGHDVKEMLLVTLNRFKPKPKPKLQVDNELDKDELDRILDKIKESGYENLTVSEKDFLFRHSKK